MKITKSLRYNYDFYERSNHYSGCERTSSVENAMILANGRTAICKRVDEIKIVHISAQHYVKLKIGKTFADDMNIEETQILIDWATSQECDFINNLSLQEILNLYRVSSGKSDWISWFDSNKNEAVAYYNLAVSEHNRIGEKD